jgi:hypothetical protein
MDNDHVIRVNIIHHQVYGSGIKTNPEASSTRPGLWVGVSVAVVVMRHTNGASTLYIRRQQHVQPMLRLLC